MSGLESISKQLFESSSTIPQTPQKKQPKKQKKGRRLAMNQEEIQQLKDKAAQTPQKRRLKLPTQEDPKAIARTLEIPNKESIQGRNFISPKMNDIEWERYRPIWEKYIDQVMIYCVLNQNIFTQQEITTIQEGIFKYMAWNTIDIWDTIDTKIPQTIGKAMPAPFYNPAKGLPWLAKEWTSIEQYLQMGEIKETITDKTAMHLSEEQLQEIQEIIDIQQEREGIIEEEEEEEISITRATKATTKGKKGSSKKGVQFGNLPGKGGRKDNPNKGKGKSKEAGKDQSTKGGDDPGDDSSSSSESSSGKKSGSEKESEDNTRKVRQLSPSEKE